MWWNDLSAARDEVAKSCTATRIAPGAIVEDGAIIEGPVVIDSGARICRGAIVRGPVLIGAGSMIGNGAVVRGPSRIGRGVRIGLGAEIKCSVLADNVAIGPQCYLGDTLVEAGAYLGAMVRTSNHRLDGHTVTALCKGELIDTGLEKLGCHIGESAALGIQVVILPGRTVAAHAVFGPGIIIEKNLPAGRYRLVQQLNEIAS